MIQHLKKISVIKIETHSKKNILVNYYTKQITFTGVIIIKTVVQSDF